MESKTDFNTRVNSIDKDRLKEEQLRLRESSIDK